MLLKSNTHKITFNDNKGFKIRNNLVVISVKLTFLLDFSCKTSVETYYLRAKRQKNRFLKASTR